MNVTVFINVPLVNHANMLKQKLLNKKGTFNTPFAQFNQYIYIYIYINNYYFNYGNGYYLVMLFEEDPLYMYPSVNA